jgi:hypothetical protein
MIDCADPSDLARFYSELLGLSVTYEEDDRGSDRRERHHLRVAFQRAPGHQPPHCPDPHQPQQFHLDVMIEDVTVAEPQVLTTRGW